MGFCRYDSTSASALAAELGSSSSDWLVVTSGSPCVSSDFHMTSSSSSDSFSSEAAGPGSAAAAGDAVNEEVAVELEAASFALLLLCRS